MQVERFREWLLSQGKNAATVSTRISNCKKVERYEGDLDEHYDADECEDLLSRMEYRPGVEQLHAIPFADGANVKNGIATLRSAVNLYVAFRSSAISASSEKVASKPAARAEAVLPASSKLAHVEAQPSFASHPRSLISASGLPLSKLWFNYMQSLDMITTAIGRSSNIVGEFGEEIVAALYNGELLPPSNSSADIALPDGRTIQVKTRVPRQTSATSLGVIRSWDFDLLVVVLFNTDGSLQKAVELNVEDAKRLAKENEYQNGNVITTTQKFFDDDGVRDITVQLKKVMES